MITTAVVGVVIIFVLAAVVRVLDATRAASWREVAAQRRQDWESRQPADAEAAGDGTDDDIAAYADVMAAHLATLPAGI